LVGHIAATMMGSLATFFTLLTLRGLVAVILGARVGAWLGAVLQLVSVVLMVEVFFFLPRVLETLVEAMLNGDAAAVAFPPVWSASVPNSIAARSTACLGSPV